MAQRAVRTPPDDTALPGPVICECLQRNGGSDFSSMEAGEVKVTDRLVRVFCSIDDPRTMKKFMKELFSPSEIEDISKRWKVMEMLKRGVSQRSIATKLGVSLCKITRGSKMLKTGGSVTNRILDEQTARR